MRLHRRQLGARPRGARTTRLRSSARSAARQSARPASTASRLARRDDRDAPLLPRQDAEENDSDLPKLQGGPSAADWHDGQFADGWYVEASAKSRRGSERTALWGIAD